MIALYHKSLHSAERLRLGRVRTKQDIVRLVRQYPAAEGRTHVLIGSVDGLKTLGMRRNQLAQHVVEYRPGWFVRCDVQEGDET